MIRAVPLLTLLVAWSLAIPAHADGRTETISTLQPVVVQDGKGAALRMHADDFKRMVQNRQFDALKSSSIALCAKYEATFDPKLQQFVFQHRSELEEFQKTFRGKFEWIDWGYQHCLQMQAFVAAEARAFPEALAILKRVEALAPMSSSSSIELGYILAQVKRPEDALVAYRHALDRSEQYPSQRGFKAAALRGTGFVLIELKRLDEAERALRDSLKVEPGNTTALNELAYIQDLRAAK